MSIASSVSDAIRRVLAHPASGVVGLVDDLLAVCREHRLHLEWQADCCRVRSSQNGSEEVVDVPLRKSVFRAILARVAVLCNERNPNSVSPYGGQGELSVGPNPAVIFRVRFANTPEEQRLELMGQSHE